MLININNDNTDENDNKNFYLNILTELIFLITLNTQ